MCLLTCCNWFLQLFVLVTSVGRDFSREGGAVLSTPAQLQNFFKPAFRVWSSVIH